jgi:hypothetical protein
MGKYYIIDTGEKMVTIAENLEKLLRKNGHHYVSYLTDLEYYIAIEEVTEDEFLNHFKRTQNART